MLPLDRAVSCVGFHDKKPVRNHCPSSFPGPLLGDQASLIFQVRVSTCRKHTSEAEGSGAVRPVRRKHSNQLRLASGSGDPCKAAGREAKARGCTSWKHREEYPEDSDTEAEIENVRNVVCIYY